MSVSNLVDSNRNLGNQSQSFCSKSSPPNILSRLVVGVVIKDVARIYDIAIHIIIGLGKIAICTTKIPYSIPARLCGSTLNYDIGKEGFAHLGFSGFYLADMFISLTNMINKYPKDQMEKVEDFFSKFLGLEKNVVSKEEKLQIKETVDDKSLSQEYTKYSIKYSPKVAKKLAKIFARNYPRLFNMLFAEYVENNKTSKKNIRRKATEYAKNCIRIYSIMYSKECSKEQALLYAKTYVNAHSKELNKKVEEQLLLSVNVNSKELKKQLKKKFEKQADTYARCFTKLFFSEYQRYLENTPETAEKQAMNLAEKYIEIFYKACIFPDEILEETANKIKDSLFKDFLREIPKMIKKEIDLERYFKLYTQKYVECCLKEGLTKNTKAIAACYAECSPKLLSEYQNYLEKIPETAKKYIEIFYKACIFPDEILEEMANKIRDSLFEDFLREIPKIIKKEINLERYFKSYTQKYIECCLKEGLTKNAKKKATRYAEILSQPLTLKMIEQFNNKRQTQLRASSSLKQKS